MIPLHTMLTTSVFTDTRNLLEFTMKFLNLPVQETVLFSSIGT